MTMRSSRAASLCLLLAIPCASACRAVEAYAPAKGRLMTRWAKDVTPESVHREYPRPQLVRPDWMNLNGLWDYAIRPAEEGRPAAFDGRILVPFPVESALSGVMKPVSEKQRLWYRRAASVPPAWKGRRVLIHFGAVDWEAALWVNGKEAGSHRGGYDPFSFDITDHLKFVGDEELVLAVHDPIDAGPQPRGKQIRNPHGIWYTPTTGIWQTAWLEPVPESSIDRLVIVPDVDAGVLRVRALVRGAAAGLGLSLEARDGERSVAKAAGAAGAEIVLKIDSAKLWSPDAPFLYGLEASLTRDGKAVDRVSSYFGMRKISLGKAADGHLRLFLNNQPLFQLGPLDQGFWPDGLYTAPTDEALRYDIEITKKLGFNMARKHVKVEPWRWYYWCDKLGLLVWQDMPSGDRYIRSNEPDIVRSEASAKQFEAELKAMIDAFRNHPSIVMWVPFNEGWGQFDTARIVDLVKAHDPTRLVNNASGWTDRGVGDVNDVHVYPGPGAPRPEARRAGVLGEFGGLGLPVRGHTWQDEKNWGYRSYTNAEDLTNAYVRLLHRLRPLIGSRGLAAAVYTQTTDVEIEVNGLLTYDRGLIKMDAERITAANQRVHLPPPRLEVVVPSSEDQGIEWRYTTAKPADGWQRPGFDDAAWQRGPGGFGSRGTPGAVVRTEWRTPEIWLRRDFELPAGVKVGELELHIHHDEDAEVYLNGELAASLTGYTTDYQGVAIDAKGAAALKTGRNTLAVRCKQTGGGQYIDVGIVSVTETASK
jgi:hypothetical protein